MDTTIMGLYRVYGLGFLLGLGSDWLVKTFLLLGRSKGHAKLRNVHNAGA